MLVTLLLLLVLSIVANGLSALAGGGAGLLQFPALLFLGLDFPTALATHKIASVALGVGATFRHLQQNTLKTGFVVLLLCSGLPGVVLGAHVILRVPDQLAHFILGIFTVGLGIYSLLSPELGVTEKLKPLTVYRLTTGGAGLFFIGFLNGSITSGTGLFVTIWLVSWFGMSYSVAVTYTLILVGLFWNGLGALTLALQTSVQWSWLPSLILGALIGGYLGAHWSIAKGSRVVKRAFEIITILVGLSLILKAFASA